LETDDLDAECARLRAAGVPVDGPHERPWGRDATFVDPDGNVFVLVAPEQVREP
jgi:predicted enzyme related to lactoylglutathione lyase